MTSRLSRPFCQSRNILIQSSRQIRLARSASPILIKTSSENRPQLLKSTTDVGFTQSREFLPNLNPFAQNKSQNRLNYTEKKLLGYSSTQMYEVVANVHRYPEFVPWCTGAHCFQHRPESFKASMTIGFPPLVERYTSLVTINRPSLVRSECLDGRLFNYLLTEWKFSPGPKHNPDSCILNFMVKFEFKSKMHSHLATVFFDEVVKTMVNSFLKRAKVIYGPDSFQAPKRIPNETS